MVPGARARAVGRLRRFASAVTYRLTHTHEGPEILTLCAQKMCNFAPARQQTPQKAKSGLCAEDFARPFGAAPGGLGGGSKRQIFRQNDRS
jgi:hypothetical protein